MHDKDPRRSPAHKERSYQPYTYTVATLSQVTGRSIDTVRKGPDMDSIVSVSAYIHRCLTMKSRPVEPSDEMLLELRATRPQWENRYPVLPVYACSHPGCERILLGQSGYCEPHGGGLPGWSFGSTGHFMVRAMSGSDAFHRIVTGHPRWHVHHIDRNKFNNRLSNLVELMPDEHRAAHAGRGIPIAEFVLLHGRHLARRRYGRIPVDNKCARCPAVPGDDCVDGSGRRMTKLWHASRASNLPLGTDRWDDDGGALQADPDDEDRS